MNFTSSSQEAAVCDFTPGYSSYTVIYQANGRWSVRGNTLQTFANKGVTEEYNINISSDHEALIYNEAGTALLSTGLANGGYTPPFIVTNLSHPGLININHEYQVAPAGGIRAGHMCVQKMGDSVVFGR
ncbi:hypothetical protein TAO_1560 [Candidatus Nitrosoglobus terrae]|uniref:Uncharacterized protein n=1 Tax=Candidatus Nitrosoglobus terrae TaxID=1630141 RepID=A0A1Q2SP67_9GAMM|nr:hypothetical protein [Candidatus Nitrosoglobus terrae]BAW80930.1 hypothetical protein TAO_1560 [Candidatus Nitrosoglobus terrae]